MKKTVVMPEVTRGGPDRDMVVRPVNRKVRNLDQRCSVTWGKTDAVLPRRQGKNKHASVFFIPNRF